MAGNVRDRAASQYPFRSLITGERRTEQERKGRCIPASAAEHREARAAANSTRDAVLRLLFQLTSNRPSKGRLCRAASSFNHFPFGRS